MSATPPPGTMPSSTAALVAFRASLTLSFFSFTSTSLDPPILGDEAKERERERERTWYREMIRIQESRGKERLNNHPEHLDYRESNPGEESISFHL